MARIILVDDDAAMRDFVRKALENDGHTVLVAQDGQEALERIKTAPAGFDLLVTDVQMPGLDGIALTREAVAVAPHLRVVLMSGFAGEFTKASGIPAAALRMVTKPFTLDQLRAEVRSALA
jgi:DNA-binding response OmpR family regulator